MANHFFSLLHNDSLRKTIILSVIAFLLVSLSLIIGISDNLPMIAILFAGLVFLYFALLHTAKKVSVFIGLTVICFLILIFDFISPIISEGIAMSVGFICLAGVISGIIGIFTRVKSWQKLPLGGALISLVALANLGTNLNNPARDQIASLSEWILMTGLQLLVTILLFGIGLVNKREKKLTRAMLLFSGLVLILLIAWGFYTSTLQLLTSFQVMMFRIYVILDIIAVFLSLYACKNGVKV